MTEELAANVARKINHLKLDGVTFTKIGENVGLHSSTIAKLARRSYLPSESAAYAILGLDHRGNQLSSTYSPAKLAEEWPHFVALMGKEQAAARLAQVWNVPKDFILRTAARHTTNNTNDDD